MAFNPAGSYRQGASQQIELDTFGGLVTSVPAANVPKGASPDNQECRFGAGFVASRYGLQKQFATPFGTTTLTYGKTFIDNVGVVRNLYLDAAGNLYEENISTAPGLFSAIGVVTAGTYAKSLTAFGKEYIAVTDGLHGADIPLHWDGTNLDRVSQDGPGSNPNIANLFYGAVTMAPDLPGPSTMVRSGNVVTVATAVNHNLQVGYRVQISKVTAHAVDTLIDTITIDGTQLPGQATVKMTTNHGLSPGVQVALHDIPNTQVATITVIRRTGGVVLIVTVAPHGLQDGAVVELIGAPAGYDNGFTIAKVLSPTAFTFFMDGADDTPAAAGTVHLVWPVPNTGANAIPGAVFEVLTCPTLDTFTIALNWSNGVWSGGGVTFQWNGTFYVSAVLSATQFQYRQYGPDEESAELGTVTPFGQAAPGEHLMSVMFRTRSGYITAPSPPKKFIANGGQYLDITNIPIGPPNTVARILAFSGAYLGDLFYIGSPATLNGERVSTSTVIEDNTTTSVVLDFSDPILFASRAITRLGNNLPAQVVLEGASGFLFYDNRLMALGQRNRILNLLNMAFDGGYLPSAPTMPTGWIADGGGAGGQLVTTGRFGGAWEVTGSGSIYQSGYLDAGGFAILTPNTQYTLRGWVKGAGETATVTISSAAAAFSASATLSAGTAGGAWLEDDFDDVMPDEIPSDMIVSVSGSTGAIIDEISIIYTENPYRDRAILASYVRNPEAFDGVTGEFGPSQDTRKVMDAGIVRGNLYMLTRDPAGRLHQTTANGITEPNGWTVNQIAANCGLVSIFGLTKSQADDTSAGGGEEWLSWISSSGIRIFSGNEPWKISQEVQNVTTDAMNADYAYTAWTMNDPSDRVIYFGLPIGIATAPSLIFPVDYKYLDTAYEIAQAAPILRGGGQGLEARELVRKWTRWNLTMNGAALMYRFPNGPLVPVFFYGNGDFPGTVAGGCGNVYVLCPGKKTDDCFGQIVWYYFTYFFGGPEIDQALNLGGQRKLAAFLQYLVAGEGRVRVTPYVTSLGNAWPLNAVRDLRADPSYDDEWPAGNTSGQRIAYKFEGLPPA